MAGGMGQGHTGAATQGGGGATLPAAGCARVPQWPVVFSRFGALPLATSLGVSVSRVVEPSRADLVWGVAESELEKAR